MFGWIKRLFGKQRGFYIDAKECLWRQQPLVVGRFDLACQMIYDVAQELGSDASGGSLMRGLTTKGKFGKMIAILATPDGVEWREDLIDELAKRAETEMSADEGVRIINDFFALNSESAWITLTCLPPQVMVGMARILAKDGTK